MLELIMNYTLYALLITGSYICQALSIASDGLDMVVTYLCDNVPGWVTTFKSDMKEVKELILEEVDAAMLYFKEIMNGEEGDLQQVQVEKR